MDQIRALKNPSVERYIHSAQQGSKAAPLFQPTKPSVSRILLGTRTLCPQVLVLAFISPLAIQRDLSAAIWNFATAWHSMLSSSPHLAGGCPVHHRIVSYFITDSDQSSICTPPPGDVAPFLPAPSSSYMCDGHKVEFCPLLIGVPSAESCSLQRHLASAD